MNFSKELINRIQAYWYKRTGEKLSSLKAEEYLHSMADLGDLIADINENKGNT